MTASRNNNSTRVRVEFDLRQSINARGFKQPDDEMSGPCGEPSKTASGTRSKNTGLT